MKLNSIRIKRFGELRDFTFEPFPSGLTLIHGSNGAGKTTLLNFIRFAFHGESSGRHRSFTHDNSADGLVELSQADQVLTVHRSFDHESQVCVSVTNETDGGDASAVLAEWTSRMAADSFARLFAVGQREVHEISALLEDAAKAGLLNRECRNERLIAESRTLRQQAQRLGESGGKIARLAQRLKTLDEDARQQAIANAQAVEELSRQHTTRTAELRAAEENAHQLEALLSNANHDVICLQRSIDEQEHSLRLELEAAERSAREAFVELERLDAESLRTQAVIRDLDGHRREIIAEIDRLSASASLDTQQHSPAKLREQVTRLEQQLNSIQQTLDAGRVHSDAECSNCVSGSKSVANVRRDFFQLCAGVSLIESEDRIRQLRERQSRVECAHADLQIHGQDLAAARARIVDSMADIPWIELVLRSHSSTDFCRCEQHKSYWAEFRATVESTSSGAELIGDHAAVKLAAPTTPDLQRAHERLAGVQRRRNEIEQRLDAIRRDITRYRTEMDREADFEGEDRLLELRFEREIVSRQLTEAVQSWCALKVAADIIEAFDTEREARRDPTVLEKASGHLHRLTEGHYRRIELGEDGAIVVHTSHGAALALEDFSRGTRDQIALSLRLVLADEFAARGEAWPLIFDDVFVDSDAKRTRIAVDLLAECAKRGCQIVYLTCHEYLCDLFREIGIEPTSFADCVSSQSTTRSNEVNQSEAGFGASSKRWRLDRVNEPHTDVDASVDQSAHQDSTPTAVSAGLNSSNIDLGLNTMSQSKLDSPVASESQDRPTDRLTKLRSLETTPVSSADRFTSAGPFYEQPEPAVADTGSCTSSEDTGIQRTSEAQQTSGAQQAAETQPTAEADTTAPAIDASIDDHVVTVYPAKLGLYSSETDERGSLPDHGRVRVEHREGTVADTPLANEDEFHLHPWSLTRQIPGLGQQAVRGLRALEIDVVGDLVQAKPELLRQQLGRLRIPVDRFQEWQRQSRLMCRIPQLDGQSARILVACGFSTPYEILAADASEILAAISEYMNSASGRWASHIELSIDKQVVAEWKHNAGRARAFARTPSSRRDRATRGSSHIQGKRISVRDLRIDAGHSLRGPSKRRGRIRRRSVDPRENKIETDVGDHRLADIGAIPEHAITADAITDDAITDDASTEQAEHADESPSLQIWRGTGRQASSERSTATDQVLSAAESAEPTLRFYLFRSSDVVDAPTIGPKTADRLALIGILTVDQLLTRPADRIAAGLKHRRIKVKDVTEWQQQSELVCTVPGLRGHDAQVLVACGITTAEALARMEANTLWGTIEPFVSSKQGERLLRSANKPDLAEVTNWIKWARARHTVDPTSGRDSIKTSLPKAG